MTTALSGEQLKAIEARVAAFFTEEGAAARGPAALPVELTLTIGLNATKFQRVRNTAATIVYMDTCAASARGARDGSNLVLSQSSLRAESARDGAGAACDTFNFLPRDRGEAYGCHFLNDMLRGVVDPEKCVVGEGVEARVFSLSNDILYARMVLRDDDSYERVRLFRGSDGTEYDAMIVHEAQALRVEVQYPPVIGALRRDDLVLRAVCGTRMSFCHFDAVLADWTQRSCITSSASVSWKEYATNDGGRLRKLTRTTCTAIEGRIFPQPSYSWQWVVKGPEDVCAPIRAFESAIERIYSSSMQDVRPEPAVSLGSGDALWAAEEESV